MTNRSYLSIGDVLTLLRQEFPDITISKIRFLESQGLVDPERTPSGYRKFYQQDVERLRWVLQQQRENFLPLKVIKDRLDDDTHPVVPTPAPVRAAPVSRPEPVLVGSHVREGDEGAARVSGRAGDESSFPGMEGAGPGPSGIEGLRLAGRDEAPPRRDTPAAAPGTGEAVVAARVGGGTDGAPGGVVTATASAVGSGRSNPPEPSAEGTEAPVAGGHEPPARGGGSGRARSRGAKPAGGGKSSRSASRRRPSGSGLSAEDLAEASGLPVEVVEELADYGLLAPTVVAGFVTYGEVDLSVAKLAAQLAQFGIEPRHLRLYKNAADREAGFVEQVVLPLLRQRNPDARDRAEATAEELVVLGRDLRSSLLQRSLGSILRP